MPLQDPIILSFDPSRDLHLYVSFPVGATPTPEGSPGLIFFHGGALFCGNAETNDWSNLWLFEELAKKGVAIISAEYTLLASNYSAWDILHDVKTLWAYIGTSLNKALAEKTSHRIDLERLAVAGSSAGGYLAYLSAIHARSGPAKPRAVLPIYATGGCFVMDRRVRPKPEDWAFQPPPSAEIERVMTEWLASPPLERCVRTPLDDPSDPRFLTFYIARWGIYLDILTGVKGLSEKLRAVEFENRLAALPSDVVPLFPECNISADLPPFFILHGDADTSVLVEESRFMTAKLSAAGVQVELVEVPNAGHGFDCEPIPDDKDGSKLEAMRTKYLLPLSESFARAFI